MTLRDKLLILATLGAAAVSAGCGRDPTPPTAPPAAFVLEEAERLTGRRPSPEHCEAKVREWRRILEAN